MSWRLPKPESPRSTPDTPSRGQRPPSGRAKNLLLRSLALGALTAVSCRTPSKSKPLGRGSTAVTRDKSASCLDALAGKALPVPSKLTRARGGTQRLHLEAAFALNTPRLENFQPSGLLIHDSKLLTISDKHDQDVFELRCHTGEATLVRYQHFQAPQWLGSLLGLDLEGLSHDGQGGLFLASEAATRILHLPRSGAARWLGPSFQSVGERVGLFQTFNAKLEGLARLGDGRVLLAAERDPRGLIELPQDGNVAEAKAWNMGQSALPMPAGRSADLSDLTEYDGKIFGLIRGAHIIAELTRGAEAWAERPVWSYEHVENDPTFEYQDQTYGLAEGLAINEKHVWVVLDNNGQARVNSPRDTRPLLFAFTHP